MILPTDIAFSVNLVNAISQESIDGISLNLAEVTTWTQGCTNDILVAKGQGHCDLRYFGKALMESRQICLK